MFDLICQEEEATDAGGRTTIPVELGICFTNNIWKRAIVYIPKDTRPCNIERVSRAKYLALDDSMHIIEHVWVQCYGEELRSSLH